MLVIKIIIVISTWIPVMFARGHLEHFLPSWISLADIRWCLLNHKTFNNSNKTNTPNSYHGLYYA